MSGLGKKIEDMLSAAAFAETGEFETARELARGSRKVLLILTGSVADTKSFTYAMSVAERIGAGLEIMCLAGKKPESETPYGTWISLDSGTPHAMKLRATKLLGTPMKSASSYSRSSFSRTAGCATLGLRPWASYSSVRVSRATFT